MKDIQPIVALESWALEAVRLYGADWARINKDFDRRLAELNEDERATLLAKIELMLAANDPSAATH